MNNTIPSSNTSNSSVPNVPSNDQSDNNQKNFNDNNGRGQPSPRNSNNITKAVMPGYKQVLTFNGLLSFVRGIIEGTRTTTT